jgi:hypothetical protein
MADVSTGEMGPDCSPGNSGHSRLTMVGKLRQEDSFASEYSLDASKDHCAVRSNDELGSSHPPLLANAKLPAERLRDYLHVRVPGRDYVYQSCAALAYAFLSACLIRNFPAELLRESPKSMYFTSPIKQALVHSPATYDRAMCFAASGTTSCSRPWNLLDIAQKDLPSTRNFKVALQTTQEQKQKGANICFSV